MDINNNQDRVTLWTRQDIRSLDRLKEHGVIRIKETHLREKFEEISDYILELYSWFIKNAEQLVCKPDGVEFPIWCSISEDNMLRPTPDTVVYKLEVDRSKIVYFDGTKWDYVLNHLYIPKDSEDEENYNKQLKEKGFKHGFSFIDKRIAHFYPQERKKVMDSWNRVFEIDDWNIFKVQANIWEIREDMIKDIEYYDAKDK
nr:DUF3841 domain-containing protein [Tissierella sp.]